MKDGLTIVLDVGKTMAKLSLWDVAGRLVARETRPNVRVEAMHYVALDAAGIESWLAATLSRFATLGRIARIIPVGHGAAAAVVRDGALACPPIDYEEPIPSSLRVTYDTERDPFAQTGSPALPDGLNLGAQLFRLESIDPGIFEGATILLWPQYWAWLLSGVAAAEVTSLGTHTDMWRPHEQRYSALAIKRGWAASMPPILPADAVLGTITQEWAIRTGLPHDTEIHCGIHDSNAALVAARGHVAIAESDSTILSTGTWFVAMRSPRPGADFDIGSLPQDRDCLVNVDFQNRPIPSARFMGGREIETLTGVDTRRIDIKPDQASLVAAVPHVLAARAMVLPSFAPGFGPFAHGRGRWISMPGGDAERRAAVSLYAALVANASLDLIGTKDRILVEGRFAEAEVFVRGLASLRPDTAIYVSNAHTDVSFGALRLVNPTLQSDVPLTRVQPLEEDLSAYRESWSRDADRMEEAAA